MPDIEMFSVIRLPPPQSEIQYGYISVPNGGGAIDINYLSITVCDTINLLSAGSTND